MGRINNLITVLRYLDLGQRVRFNEDMLPLEIDEDDGVLYYVYGETPFQEHWVYSELSYNDLLELSNQLTEEQLVGMRATLALTKERRRNAR